MNTNGIPFDELTEREERLHTALEGTQSTLGQRLNDMAPPLAVNPHLQDTSSSIMDRHLARLVGQRCTIVRKNGVRNDYFTLMDYDQTYVLVSGYFDVGLSDPVYRELVIARSEIAIITHSIPMDAVLERIGRLKERYDPTA